MTHRVRRCLKRSGEMRGLAKNTGFAAIYGAGTATLAETAGVTLDKAEDFARRYGELFPEVAQWQQRLMHEAQRSRDGREWPHVRTILGRKLPVEPDKVYKVTNFRDQGSCAEIAKMAVNRLANSGLDEYFRLMIHDEVLLECPDDEVEVVERTVAKIMRDDFSLENITFTTSATTGGLTRWGSKYIDEDNPLMRTKS